MKRAICAAFVLCLLETVAGSAASTKLRVADAAAEACLASCADANASCKRVCPATFSTPCLNGCDSQAQACRQSCLSK
jgi:hypothetical protein